MCSVSRWMQGMRYVNGFDDTEIVAGAGTIGMEILEQVREGGYATRGRQEEREDSLVQIPKFS